MRNDPNVVEVDKNIRQIALNHLARREYTRFMLKEKLLQKGFLQQSVDVVLDSLSQQGFLNDERFCEAFIARRIRQGYGPIRIAIECQKYGISEAVINAQLPQDMEIWLAIIHKIREKKFSFCQQAQEKPRQIRYLLYRGFSLSQIKESQKITLIND
jgi:regulatory protein